MQYIPCNSALLAQEALFLPKKALFMPKDLQKKVRKSQQNSVCSGLKFSSESKLFDGCHPCSRASSATLEKRKLDNTNWRCLLRSFSAWKWDAVCKIHGQRSEMQRGCFFPHTIFLYFCLKHVVRNGFSHLTTPRSIEQWKHQYPPSKSIHPSIHPSLPSWVILIVSITFP